MKEKLKKNSILERWLYTQSPLVITRPALQETAVCLVHMFGGFLLSCGRLSQPLPFAIGYIAAVGGGLRGLCALLGAAAGYLTMQPFAQGLELTSAAILTFVVMYIFSTVWIVRRHWFRMLVSGAMYAAVGAIFLFSQAVTTTLLIHYGITTLISALSPLAFDSLLRQKRRSAVTLAAVACFLIGAAAIPLPMSLTLGPIAAIALGGCAARSADFGLAAAIGAGAGLSLDAASASPGVYTMLLFPAVLLPTVLPRRHPWFRTLIFCGVLVLLILLQQGQDFTLLLSAALGAGLSLLIPSGLVSGREESAIAQASALAEQQLTYGHAALRALYQAIDIDPDQHADQARQKVFDLASAKVCRQCVHYGTCWEKQYQRTHSIFQEALTAVLERGEALPGDFPEDFVEFCRHLDGLLIAANQELNNILYASRNRTQTEEYRLIASRILVHAASILQENARRLRSTRRIPEEAYVTKIGVSAHGCNGRSISGDRGICLHTEDGRLFTILCDGIGTGPDAADESLLAVDTLAALIQSGLPVDGAMELMNGMYILRDSGSFSTMDVLELSLITGQGTLYKWGAAPSYIKSGNIVKKVGTAAPPPGLGVGSTNAAEVIRLSLWGGDMLILVSDGIVCEQTEDLLRSYEGENVKELAGLLVAQAEANGGEDDMTAAVIRIEESRI